MWPSPCELVPQRAAAVECTATGGSVSVTANGRTAALIFSPPTEPLLLGNGPQQYSDAITYSARRCNGHSRRLRARYFDFSAFTDCLYQDLSNPDPLGSGRLGRPRAVIVTPDFTTAPGEFQGEATLGPHGHCFWVPFSLALGQGGGKVEIFVLHPMVMG